MARIRTIKPEFFTSEDIIALSPLARLLYVALWCESDKEGRLVWKPKTFKLRYMPGDNCVIDELCKEIVDLKLIVLYGDGFAYIPSFKSHQHINPRETASQLPEPDLNQRVGTRQPRVSDETVTHREEGKGREGKGTRETAIAKDFSISERVANWANEKNVQDLQTHFDNFVLVCKAKNYKYTDWDSAFMRAVNDNWAKVQARKGGLSL